MRDVDRVGGVSSAPLPLPGLVESARRCRPRARVLVLSVRSSAVSAATQSLRSEVAVRRRRVARERRRAAPEDQAEQVVRIFAEDRVRLRLRERQRAGDFTDASHVVALIEC